MTEEQETEGWTFEQNKRFEQALALCLDAEGGTGGQDHQGIGRWKKVAAMVPGKSQAEVRRHYASLLQDIASIEAGQVALPHYPRQSSSSPTGSWDESMNRWKGAKASEQERKKGIPWTEEEHRLFLLGLDKFGKGDWRSISRNFVVSRTPTQVASHAQKYFIRLNSINKDNKRRSSIHDITNAASPPPPPPPPAAYPPPRPPPPPPTHHLFQSSPPAHHLPALALIPPSQLSYAIHHQ